MKQPEVTVIDYGVGNLLSVRRGLEQCGAAVSVTPDPELILSAARVVLPGVGAFANGMSELNQRDLSQVVREVAERGTPLMGICLGMQMLLDESEEFGFTPGLGLIPGKVVSVPAVSSDGSARKIPHIGWSELAPSESRRDWSGTLLSTIEPGEAVYFVHSFMAAPASAEHRIADCVYLGARVSAAIGKDNVFGCQFHPEKSGEVGLKVLSRFLAT